jgi:hypothetical protein
MKRKDPANTCIGGVFFWSVFVSWVWTDSGLPPIIVHPPESSKFFLEAAVSVSSRFKDSLQSRIADHFESALSTVGVLIAIVVTTIVLLGGNQGAALIFIVWFQGLIFWAVRRHVRLGRQLLIRKLRVMLQDRINNQLTVLVGLTDIRADKPAPASKDDAEVALTAARAVSREIENLSMETLRTWEARYSEHFPTALR